MAVSFLVLDSVYLHEFKEIMNIENTGLSNALVQNS